MYGMHWEREAMNTAVPLSHEEALELFVKPTYFITAACLMKSVSNGMTGSLISNKQTAND